MESAQVTVMAALPVFATVTLPALFGDPTVAVKAREGGEMVKPPVDTAGLTVNVTGMILVVAPVAATVTVAL
jgi:hypothetical protein